MKKTILFLVGLTLTACKGEPDDVGRQEKAVNDTTIIDQASDLINSGDPVRLNREEANRLAQLPLDCINVEYPNKLNQVLGSGEDLGEPKVLHPAFYGCFDWHSSVHGHWSLVSLLKQFPDLQKAEEIREKLKASLSEENIQGEVAYFHKEHNETYERTYGWAWLLKLAEELHTWDDPLARELEANLRPLTDLIVEKFKEFLPKLNYPIRVGEHTNTAFAMTLAYDYAEAAEREELKNIISKRAKDFYLGDADCPVTWEPSGFDFLSPCLNEVDIMRRVLPESAFRLWMKKFMPQLREKDFSMEFAEVTDRSDGKLVHLDGLNFNRAWVLHGLANQYPERYSHLRNLANEHLSHSFPNLVGDSYEGGHWLGSFALYALQESQAEE